MLETNAVYRRVAVFTVPPAAIKPEDLRKPSMFILRLSRTSTILNVHPIPNLLESFGVSVGGGPPGFTALVPVKDDPELERNFLILAYTPGAKAISSSSNTLLGRHLGTCTSAGTLLNYFMLEPVGKIGERLKTAPLGQAVEGLQKAGLHVTTLVEYKLPDPYAAPDTQRSP